MKKIINMIVSVFFMIPIAALSQTIFSEQIIIDPIEWPTSVNAADLDGDNDLDIVVCCWTFRDAVVWYENLDGQGSFSDRKVIISTSWDCMFNLEITTADLDNDGDLDIIVASEAGNYSIAWFENKDGIGEFSEIHRVDEIGNPSDLFVTDIDNDGNIDIIPSLYIHHQVVWYQNQDDLGHFGEKKVINSSFTSVNDVFASDLDNDNDKDIIVCSCDDDFVGWFQHLDGNGTFSNQKYQIGSLDCPRSVLASDIDGDADFDIVSCSYHNDMVAWFENQDGAGSFSDKKVITTKTDSVLYLYAADLDLDNDIDILSASIGDDKICWFENQDGKGDFSDQIIITDKAGGATSVHAADMDGDGDIDILSTSEYDHKVAWYENLTNPASVQNDEVSLPGNFRLYQNYPNPFNPSTTIKYTLYKSGNVTLKIYNLSGEEVETLVNGFKVAGEHAAKWHSKGGYASGVYFYRLQAGDYSETRKLILLR
ncbi:MAG: FG-GAP-like repeat-containing protein [Ignavibacteria bacterium]|jgi:hypothetical protein